jgi:hypothetical protein
MQQYKKVIFGILILNGLIIIDSFLLPPVERNEIYYDRDIGFIGATFMSNYNSGWDYLVTTNGHRYEVPFLIKIGRTEGDPVTIGLSAILRRPYRLRWNAGGRAYSTDIRAYTNGFMYPFVLWLTTLYSLLLLFFPVALRAEKREVYLWMAAVFSAMFLAFDFW